MHYGRTSRVCGLHVGGIHLALHHGGGVPESPKGLCGGLNKVQQARVQTVSGCMRISVQLGSGSSLDGVELYRPVQAWKQLGT